MRRSLLPPVGGLISDGLVLFYLQKHTVENVQPIAGRDTEAPEISNEIEMQVRWSWFLSDR